MELTIQVNPHERTVRFREVSSLAAGDVCSVTLDGVRGADVPTLRLALYRDAASGSPVASCPSFSPVPGHSGLASGILRMDTLEMAGWFDAVLPDAESSDDGGPGERTADGAERAARTDGWLVVSDSSRTWAACRVPVILRPGAGTSGVVDPTSLSALVEGIVSAAMSDAAAAAVSEAMSGKADKAVPSAVGNLASLDASGNLSDSGVSPSGFAPASGIARAALAAAVQESLDKADSAVQPSSLFDGSQIKSSLLPSYVDDVLEYSALSGFPGSGETGKIYVARDTNKTYRWSGSRYVEIAASPVTSVNGQTGAVTLAIPAEQVNADWNATEGKAKILNKPDTFPPGSHVHGMGDVTGLVATLGGKANRSEMSVTPGTGADADKTTIQLKDGTSATVLTAHQDVSGKADTSVVNAALALKADADALPYALAVPGEWTVSGLSENETIYSGPTFTNSGESYYWRLVIIEDSVQKDFISDPWYDESHENDLSATFRYESRYIIATRASLPDHLADRAVNVVTVSETKMLTLPAEIPGRVRDFVVDMTVVGSQAVSFVLPGGTAPTWVGAQPSSQFAAGRHVISISELSGGFSYAEGLLDPSLYEVSSNKVTSLSAQSTDAQYPSAACVYALVGDVEAVLTAINGGVAS